MTYHEKDILMGLNIGAFVTAMEASSVIPTATASLNFYSVFDIT
jgi:hypothetical protein